MILFYLHTTRHWYFLNLSQYKIIMHRAAVPSSLGPQMGVRYNINWCAAVLGLARTDLMYDLVCVWVGGVIK